MRIATSSTRGDKKGNPDKQIEQANKLAKCVLAYKGTTRQERQNKLPKARGGFLPHPSLPPRARPETSPGRHGRDRLGGGSPPRLRQGQRPPRQALPQARPQGCVPGYLHPPRSDPCCFGSAPARSDGVHVRSRCAEFTKVAARTAIGFVVMGFVGFFVKLIFIPINNIIVGSG